MQVHFMHWHVHNTVVMLEEGNLPLPRCPRCDLQVTRKALNGRHLGTSQFKKGGGAEAKTVSRDGDAVKRRAGVPRLWETDGGGVEVPLPRADTHVDR